MVDGTHSEASVLEEARRLRERGLELSGEGHYADAAPLFREALALREDLQGRVHPEVAQLLVDLAVLEEARGDDDRAESCYRRALAALQEAHGGLLPAAAEVHSRLARLFERQGRSHEVRRELRCALEIDEHHLGMDHPALIARLEVLARQLGDGNVEAEILLQRARGLRRRMNDSHPLEISRPEL